MPNVIWIESIDEPERRPTTPEERQATFEPPCRSDCEATYTRAGALNKYYCTLDGGHQGPHIAGSTRYVHCIWEDTNE